MEKEKIKLGDIYKKVPNNDSDSFKLFHSCSFFFVTVILCFHSLPPQLLRAGWDKIQNVLKHFEDEDEERKKKTRDDDDRAYNVYLIVSQSKFSMEFDFSIRHKKRKLSLSLSFSSSLQQGSKEINYNKKNPLIAQFLSFPLCF